MNMAAAYSALTVPQLKGMLGAALADHKRELEETKAKWAAEVSALREAMSKNLSEADVRASDPRRTTTPRSSVSSTPSTASWRRPTP